MGSFSVDGKVALITGGTSGIGLAAAKQLLQLNAKGIVIVGFNEKRGPKVREELQEEFGKDRVDFCRADISQKDQFEKAFKKTIELFNQLDIVINSGAVCDDTIWERMININVVGTLNGSFMALEEYLPKYMSGSEGVIVNLSSIAGLDPIPFVPFYSTTKAAIIHFSRALGITEQYERTKVRVVVLCPGATDTPMLVENFTPGPFYDSMKQSFFNNLPKVQTATYVGKAICELIKNGENGSVWTVEEGKPIYQADYPGYQNNKKRIMEIP